MNFEAVEPVFQPTERFNLNPSSPIPLYHQMEQIILSRISKVEMVGKRMPSEFELIEIFDVSRATVKKTLDNLVNKGLIERRRGVGTRVIKHQIIEDLAHLTGYTEKMESKGLTTRTQILEVKEHIPSTEIRNKLQLEEGEKSLSVRRLRGTDQVFPIVLLRSEIPVDLKIDPHEDFSHSLYWLIEEKYHIPIVWGEETIEASTATADQARYLQIRQGDTVLIMDRITYTHGNRPIEYVRGIYRPDRYKFSIRLNR